MIEQPKGLIKTDTWHWRTSFHSKPKTQRAGARCAWYVVGTHWQAQTTAQAQDQTHVHAGPALVWISDRPCITQRRSRRRRRRKHRAGARCAWLVASTHNYSAGAGSDACPGTSAGAGAGAAHTQTAPCRDEPKMYLASVCMDTQ